MKSYIKGILVACFLMQGQLALAVDGELDDTFGTGGIVLFSFTSSNFQSACGGGVVRHDGRIVAAGLCETGLALVSFLADGSEACMNCLEPISMNSNDFWEGSAVQPDNKVVAVGIHIIMQPFRQAFIVGRYNKDCTLDTSFGNEGIIEVPFSGSLVNQAFAVALTQDGRIVVVGTAQDAQGNGPFYVVVVLNPNGSLDSSFANGAGRRVYGPDFIPINTEGSIAFGVAIQADGSIVLVGQGSHDGRNHFQVVRITPDGNLDKSFGSNLNGVEEVPFGMINEGAIGVDLRPDGRIVAIGGNLDSKLRVAQLQNNGTLDTSFGVGGTVTFDNVQAVASLNIQNDQKIIVGGNRSGEFLIIRFTEDGQLDTSTFNPPDGFVTSLDDAELLGTALQCDGKIVAFGIVGLQNQIGVVRYLNENGNDEVIVEPTITQPINLGNCDTLQPIFRGAAQNPANITVYIDGQEAGHVITQGAANTWEFTPPAPLATGSHTVQMVAEYKSGNQNCITDPFCCGVCLGCQSCISEAVRPKYCPLCVDFPIC